MGCIAPRRKPVRSDSARRNTALVDDSLTMFPVVRSDGIEHEYQQIVRTAKGTLLAMGPVLLHSQDSGRSWNSIEGFPAVPDSRDNAEGRHLTALSDGRVLVTWGIGRDNKGLRYGLGPKFLPGGSGRTGAMQVPLRLASLPPRPRIR